MRNSVHCIRGSTLDSSNPLGTMILDGLRGRIVQDARWAMLGAQSCMGDAQHRAELRDAHWSHRSDPFHYKSVWQSVSASEEGVKRHLGVRISDVT